MVLATGCSKDESNNNLSSIAIVSQIINPTTAIISSNIYNNKNITQYGVVWSTEGNPTTELSTKNIIDNTTGEFSNFEIEISGLIINKTYYLRTFIIKDNLTIYSDEISFTTPSLFYKGEYYQGGLICFIDGSGEHGLIVSKEDLGEADSQTSAISMCNNFVSDGYDDWYLPGKAEWQNLYSGAWALKFAHENLNVSELWYWMAFDYVNKNQVSIRLETVLVNVNGSNRYLNWRQVRAFRSF